MTDYPCVVNGERKRGAPGREKPDKKVSDKKMAS